jgi:glucose-1-phosphate cytidylyltransferase
MKVVILAGGLGTRISEETDLKPKPMVQIGNQPIVWHIMNSFAIQGFDDFIIATGYKGQVIHDWVQSLKTDWKIQAIDTGLETQTGGRINRIFKMLELPKLLVTYGDALGSVDINSLLNFHSSHNKIATVTAVRPPARFGVLESENGLVMNFGEKRQSDAGWINGGHFVLDQEVTKYIHSDDEPFELGALQRLVEIRELMSFHHHGFWQPMDTLREKVILHDMVSAGNQPWLDITGTKN